MKTKDRQKNNKISRRTFLTTSALVGGCALFGADLAKVDAALDKEENFPTYELAKPENIIYTSCLQCHVSCQLKCKFWDGTLAKITGNPYSPQNFLPHIPYKTSPFEAATIDGKLCAKGQSGIQTYYDPYRVRKVLKRQGPRGSNKWKSIPFEQFIQEVVEGGQLFKEIGDDRHYPGFKEVYVLKDKDLSKKMAKDAKNVAKGKMSVEEFKQKYKEHLDVLIDPDHPDLGPKNNGFIFDAGRIEHGRKELMKWFTALGLGSVNYYEHTTICEQSHHIAFSMLTNGATHHMKPDLSNCEFVIFWGTGAFSANFGLTPMAEKVTRRKVEIGMKTAVVDPRLSNDAAKADWWLPVEPEHNTTLAFAMLRWIIENNRYDKKFLENANMAAAKEDGESSFTNASYLVKIVDGHALELLRASEVGLGSDKEFVVMKNGEFKKVDPDDKNIAVEGELFVDTDINGIKVKSSMQLLKEEVFKKSVEEYAKECGVDLKTIIDVAREFTSHGRRAAIDLYRGPVQNTDGYYAGCAIIMLNLLIGNTNYVGGLIAGGGHWHEAGGKPGSVYHFKKMNPNALKAFGPKITREKTRYEDTTLYQKYGYPAKRPWYPFTGNVYQEVIPSIANKYPYPGKILFLHKGTPAFAIPGGNQQAIDYLRDPEKIPLFIACDVVIGETSMYADYIVPDLTYLERWGTPHVTPDVPTKTSKVRQPAGKPLTEEVTVYGNKVPLSLEAFILGIAEKLNLPGFGKDAFGPGMDFTCPEDWYLKLVANIAYGDKPGEAVPPADDVELELFRKARKHLPPSVFDEKRWKKALRNEDEWRRVVYVLNRGGRFAEFGSTYGEKFIKAKHIKKWNIFVEKVAKQKNSMSGKYFYGYPVVLKPFDCTGEPLIRTEEYPFSLITFKEPYGGQSRTISNYWSNIGLLPENKVWINSEDAKRLNIKPEQRVRIVSKSNPQGKLFLKDGQNREIDIVGKVRITEGIRPGVIAVSWHYGHWAYGSNDVVVDGKLIEGDKRRAGGLCTNPVLDVDPKLKDVCLSDLIGGSASYSNSKVRIVSL